MGKILTVFIVKQVGFRRTIAEGWENLKETTAFLSPFNVLDCL